MGGLPQWGFGTRSRAVLALLPSLALLVWWADRWTGSLAGDSFAVYIPTARRLLDGHVLGGYGAMVLGIGRLPGYPMVLAAAGLVSSDLFAAAELSGFVAAALGLVAAGILVRRLGASWAVLCGAGLATVGTATWVRSTNEVLPDMVACAVFYGAVLAASRAVRVERRGPVFVCGVLIATGLMLRLNYIALLALGPYLIAERALLHRGIRQGLVDIATFAVGLATIVVPLGPTVYRMQQLGFPFPRVIVRTEGGDGVSSALAAVPAGLGELPVRVSSIVPAWFVALSLLGLVAIVLQSRSREGRLAFGPILVASSAMLVALGPIHFEARYYVWLVPLLAGAAVQVVALALGPLDRRASSVASIACGAAVAWLSFPQADALARKATENYAQAEQACRQLEAWAASLDGGVLVGSSWRGATYAPVMVCPFRAGQTALHVVSANPEVDFGVDHWFSFRPMALEAPPGSAKVLESPQYELWTTTATEGVSAFEVRHQVSLDFVAEYPSRRCMRRTVDLEVGRAHVVVVEARSRGAVVPRLTVRSGDSRVSAFSLGARALRLRLEPQRQAQASVEVCPADPAAIGEIRLTSMQVGAVR